MSVLLVTQYVADMDTADVERVQAFCGSVLRARYATRGELDEIEPRRDTLPALPDVIGGEANENEEMGAKTEPDVIASGDSPNHVPQAIRDLEARSFERSGRQRSRS